MKPLPNYSPPSPFQFLLRTASFAAQPCFEFLRTLLFLHLLTICRILLLPLTLFSLPIRAFSALYRQNKMEIRMHKMKKALEAALWDRKELKERLDGAVRDRQMMEMMLTELESEHDDAILQIEVLLKQVKELKDGARRYNEDPGGTKDLTEIQNNFKTPSLYKAPDTKLRKTRKMSRDDQDNEHLADDDVLASQRATAMYRSLFSAILSLVVAMVVWEAKDSCIPLVMALFVVVTMSLMSVVRFFYALGHKPYARDAVALLCFNWFLLGALACPTLLRMGRVLKDVVF